MTCAHFQNGECQALHLLIPKINKDTANQTEQLIAGAAMDITEVLGKCPAPKIAETLGQYQRHNTDVDLCSAAIVESSISIDWDQPANLLLITYLRMIHHGLPMDTEEAHQIING